MLRNQYISTPGLSCGKYTLMNAQFLTDETGRRTSVLLPIEDYQRLLDDIEDLAAIAERRDEPTVPHKDLVSELKRDGILPA